MKQKTAKIIVPLCKKCISQRGKICPACQKKYNEYLINHNDIRVFRTIYELLRKFKNIIISIWKVIGLGETFLLVVGAGSKSQLIGVGGETVRQISHSIKKKPN